MATPELLTLTIAELAPKIRARQVSPVEVTTAALALSFEKVPYGPGRYRHNETGRLQ